MHAAAYLAGLISADGHLDGKEKSVSIYSNNKAFSKRVKTLLEEASGKHAHLYPSKNAYKVYAYCPDFYDQLIRSFNLISGRKSDRLRFPVLRTSDTKEFLAGFADGDGCIYMDKRKRRGKVECYPRVEIASKSKRFLQDAKRFLEKNGVSCGSIKNGRRVYRLCIYGSHVFDFLDFIGFRHPQKILSFPIPQGVD